MRPGAAGILVVAIVGILGLAFRPWDGAQGATVGAPAAASASPRPVAFAPSDRPSGDGERGPAATTATARRSSMPAAPTSAAEPARLLVGYRWPTRDARITNSYGLGRPSSFFLDGTQFHDGIDVSSFCGARIVAAHDGVVLGVGRHTDALLGWVGDLTAFRAKLDADDAWGTQAIAVVIDDGNGYRSVYAHLGLAEVKKDEAVRAGDLIGWEGASGNATGCHLHYAIFNPQETATLALDPKIARKSKLPPLEIARINPLDVLPPLEAAGITWGWGAR